MFTTKHIYGLVLVKYIREPIIYLYKVASTTFEASTFNSFKLVFIRVVIALKYNIPNILKISTVYFPWFRKISS